MFQKIDEYLNQILTDQFVSSWYNDIENSSRGQLYGPFKKDWSRKLFSEIKREN